MNNKPKSSAASQLNIIAYVVYALCVIAGIIGGVIVGKEILRDILPLAVLIGTMIGFAVGHFNTLILRYLAELGINLRIIADASIRKENVSETDQILIYKDLLDSGAITQEEYETKRKELLNL